MKPLAYRIRPQEFNDIVGQDHLVGENGVITKMLNKNTLFSFILYGPAGCGKTSIAEIIASKYPLSSFSFNASCDTKDKLKEIANAAKYYQNTICIIDEIHRMNKDKQDLMLPYIESGLITLIGLTTSNPYHKINPAIRSRCQIFKLNSLTSEEIAIGLKRACNNLNEIIINDDGIKYIAALSGGDMRSALTLLEVCYNASSDKKITIDLIKSINSKPVFLHDKNEDGYYDVLSAFQKSIRGSDVQASLHYLARMIEAEDLDSIYRRMTVIAYEDIGLANPGMGPKVHAAIEASELVGLPEARIILSAVVIELALSPKSNSAEIAIDAALNDIRSGQSGTIPAHLKNGNPDYKYPHNYPKYWVNQQYLPDNLKSRIYYKPKINNYEINLNKINSDMKK